YSKDAGKNIVHGKPLSDEDISSIKKQMNIRDIPFTISGEVLDDFQTLIASRNEHIYEQWNQMIETLEEPQKSILNDLMNTDKMISLTNINYERPDNNEESLREASYKVLNSLASVSPLIIGGAADLSSSTLT